MGFLRFLESIRTGVGDVFFSTVTHLGEETMVIVVGLLFFWCINKRQGYYLLSVGLLGTVINQFLKLLCRIPRPWVRDDSFTIVESARAEATGYSFPSGHTQTAVGIFGGIARWNKQTWVRIASIAVCVLVPLSRMYLGVHTLWDTTVSALLALLMVFGLYPLMSKASGQKGTMRLLLAGMTLLAVAYLAFVHLYNFPADTDPDNLAHGTKNAYTMLGCLVGLWVVFEVDERFIHFETKAVWWAQVLKLALGIIPLLGIKAGLKQPLYMLMGESYLTDGIRYFLIVLFAGCVWPLTFPLFAKLGKKKVE